MVEQGRYVPVERHRVEGTYQCRLRGVPVDRYAPWQPAVLFLDTVRKRAAARELHRADAFPGPGTRCLEVGFGTLGWLPHLLDWGVREPDLHGIEQQPDHVEVARQILPMADLRCGDAGDLPWPDATFDLVIASMLFTAIPDQRGRRRAASEISRVLASGGALLWYDIAVNNPWNRTYRRVTRTELRGLFPGLTARIRSVNLAPPVARLVAPRSWTLAVLLEAVSPVRPFLLAVLLKPLMDDRLVSR